MNYKQQRRRVKWEKRIEGCRKFTIKQKVLLRTACCSAVSTPELQYSRSRPCFSESSLNNPTEGFLRSKDYLIIWSHSRVLRAGSASDLSNMAFPCCLDFYALLGAQTSLRFHACGPSQRDFCERFAMNVPLYLDALYIWVYCKVVKS